MENYDIVILGSGPGGYVTAIRASQLGFKTAIVEKESLGGICLNWGCIPTKALLKSAEVFEYLNHAENYGLEVENFSKNFEKVINRSRNVANTMSKGVNFLMKKNKIKVYTGFGKVNNDKTINIKNENEENTINAKHIIIATGARSREIESLKRVENKIIGYREAMTLKEQPKEMVIVGSGAIGVEFAYFYNTMGTNVTLIEYEKNIAPIEDKDISKELEKILKKAGLNVLTSSKVVGSKVVGKKVEITVESDNKEIIINADVVLSAVGIKSNIENIGIEEVGIEIENDKIKVDSFYKTNIENIYSIGDVVLHQL